jgi:amino acid adenylation domain-containing protein
MMLQPDPSTSSQGIESASLPFADLRAAPSQTSPSLPRRIAAIARSHPDSIALLAPCGTLTYGELERQAAQLASHLAWAGVARESVVAICLPRSFERVVAQLAVMKAGGAFLPLDPSWPVQRLRKLVDDSGAAVLIAGEEQAPLLASEARPCISPQRDAALAGRFPPVDCDPAPEDLAYLIYTSGSTGEPKGVELTHANLANLVDWHLRAFAVTADDRASHLAGLGFDAAVWEVWPYLAAGAAIALASDSVRTAPDLLQAWLLEQKITIGFVPTSLAESMLSYDWPADTALRILLIGAEAAHLYPPPGLPFRLVNNYGPTECTVVATSCLLPPDGVPGASLPPIGGAIDNVTLHLLDEAGQPVAAGAVGEIYIGGAGVGRGYRNRPDLTAAAFLADRFSDLPGARLYRTGDLACRLPDGQFAFRGRRDDQEKIRGHRVEPDEIAAVLDRHDKVASCLVMARGAAAERQLVAYVVPDGHEAPTAEVLRAYLAESLPDYMIPSSFVRLDALPLNASGKIDKPALPEPSEANSLDQQRYRAPETPLEQRLAGIVASVLGVERIGADDNFFLMGGHSLLGTQVVMRIRDGFGVDLTLLHLFEAPTVAQLAAKVEGLVREKLAAMSDEEAARQLQQ